MNWLIGRWQLKNEQIEVTAQFTLEGTFNQTTTTSAGKESYSGRFQQAGQILQLLPNGALTAMVFNCRFIDQGTLVLTDAMGQAVQMKRISTIQTNRLPNSSNAPPEQMPTAQTSGKANSEKMAVEQPQPTAVPVSASAGQKPAALVLEKTWEPNERAYWFQKPKGWIVTGGVFNVNPLQMNGPGNTIAPKNDLSVKKDEAGTVMFRWAPVWFYTDLSYAPTVSGGFPPGSYYKGMLVKPIPTAKDFLIELLRQTRPRIEGFRIITEDPMREVADAYVQKNQQVNAGLVQMRLRPNTYDAAALLVEYREDGQQFREALITVIVDSRASTFAWSNERTIMMRAPAAEYESWKPVLDVIRTSDHINPQWMADVNQNINARTQSARETDRYINRVANEILAHRRQSNAEIRHAQWLFITGQNEYKNPFTGEIERDTSSYRHRWVNNQGDIILTDHNDFDPNEKEEYKTREWKPSPVLERP